jgi:hypothetical protein
MGTLERLANEVFQTHGWLLGFIIVPITLVFTAVTGDALYEYWRGLRRRWHLPHADKL